MVDPLITPAIIGANCLLGLITGPVGNRADWAVVAGARKVGHILRLGTPKQNHHIMRATQAAYVEAMCDMAKACAEIADDTQSESAAADLNKLTRRSEFKDFRYEGEHFPLDQANAAIDRMFSGGVASIDGGRSESEHRAFGLAVVQDLQAWGIVLSELQARLFTEGLAHHSPWHLRFRIAFGEKLISDESARAIFTQERLGEIRSNGIELIDAVANVHAAVEQGFANLGASLDRTISKVDRLVTLAEEAAIPGISVDRLRLEFASIIEFGVNLSADQMLALIRERLKKREEQLSELLCIAAADKEIQYYQGRAAEALAAGDDKAAIEALAGAQMKADGRFEGFADFCSSLASQRAHALLRDFRPTEAHQAWMEAAKYLSKSNPQGAAQEVLKGGFELAQFGHMWGRSDVLLLAARHWENLVANALNHSYTQLAAVYSLESARTMTAAGRMMVGEVAGDLLSTAADRLIGCLHQFKITGEMLYEASARIVLSTVLLELAKRADKVSRPELLEQAEQIANAGLSGVLKEHSPHKWGLLQLNLVMIFLALEESSAKSNEYIDRAVNAARLALAVPEITASPEDCRGARLNLGIALTSRFQRAVSGRNQNDILEAVSILGELASSLLTSRPTRDWIVVQHNFGEALKVLAERARPDVAKHAWQNAFSELGEVVRAIPHVHMPYLVTLSLTSYLDCCLVGMVGFGDLERRSLKLARFELISLLKMVGSEDTPEEFSIARQGVERIDARLEVLSSHSPS